MKAKTIRTIEEYKKACKALLEEFVTMYWRDEEWSPRINEDYFVIGSWSITGSVCFGDYFISWDEVEYCVIYQVPMDTFWAWRQYEEENNYDAPINFKNFFESYPNLPCTKVKTTTKKKGSTTKPSTGSRNLKGKRK